MRAGEVVVVRTNYYPAWTARMNDTPVDLFSRNDQLAFRAPADGSYVVTLEYPRRYWLNFVAIGALLACMVIGARMRA